MKQSFVLLILFVAVLTAFAEPTNDRWVEQKAKTKDLQFSLKISTNYNGEPAPVLLRIISCKTKKIIQEIPIIEADQLPMILDDELLEIEDANFDGHPDISIYAVHPGAGPNGINFYYIYDKNKKKFKFDEKLSSLTQVSVNPKTKTITSDFRGSCCDHSSETYRYISGRLTLVESWREYVSDDLTMTITTTGKLRKGKMRYTKKRKPIAPEKL